ncbi:hypothetical protein Tsubulata_024368 [Turnera subulata]|uniref:J domain-containing protein n=1 Tax=Turnera subulata TaxID=218843 RepID=A0A9Q0GMZ5_9ROSI|nr:hypothetical protein Tsubulata_024368 [Turnera subulata]
MDGGGGSYRMEGERWLAISEKLLVASDLNGARSFAIRARDSDPRLQEYAEQIVTVCDTLLASELRTPNNNYDYYAILQIARLTQSVELIAGQYRKLALLLNPQRNRLLYADQAFKLVAEAWVVLSNPAKKAMYDQEFQVSHFGQLGQLGQLGRADNQFFQTPQRPTPQVVIAPTPLRRSPKGTRDGKSVVEDDHTTQQFVPEPTRQFWQPTQPSVAESSQSAQQAVPEPPRPPPPNQRKTADSTPPATAAPSRTKPSRTTPAEPQVPSFWTACPYCYILYEYPKEYEECTLRCQSCKRAFQAVTIPAPPVVTGKEKYFCCWGFFPLGFSGNVGGKGGLGSNWSPFSAMFATPFQKKPKVIYKDDVYVDLSESSEEESDSGEEWASTSTRSKKAKVTKGRASNYSRNVRKQRNERGRKGNGDGAGRTVQQEMSGKGEGSGVKKRAAGKLDLNVMFSNELEDGAPGVSQRHGPGHGEEDNIEGIGFFEGLDEFLSTLPILSVVGEDKCMLAGLVLYPFLDCQKWFQFLLLDFGVISPFSCVFPWPGNLSGENYYHPYYYKMDGKAMERSFTSTSSLYARMRTEFIKRTIVAFSRSHKVQVKAMGVMGLKSEKKNYGDAPTRTWVQGASPGDGATFILSGPCLSMFIPAVGEATQFAGALNVLPFPTGVRHYSFKTNEYLPLLDAYSKAAFSPGMDPVWIQLPN